MVFVSSHGNKTTTEEEEEERERGGGGEQQQKKKIKRRKYARKIPEILGEMFPNPHGPQVSTLEAGTWA